MSSAEDKDREEEEEEDEVDEITAADDKAIQEEYKVWKKNSPFLYDKVLTHSLEWPSLTVQWQNEVTMDKERQVSIHKIILGTHTCDDEQNYLMIGEVLLPFPDVEVDARNYDDERGEIGGFGGTLSKIDIKVRINHEGEVNKARVSPHNKFLIATKAPSSTVFVFDYSKHPSMPSDNICRPQHRCLGHTAEGYGLSWSPLTAGRLLSGADDALVCMWDLTEAGAEVQALQIRHGHTSVVEDVDWSHHHAHIFGSVGDDRQLLIWDARDLSNTPMRRVANAHGKDINCLAFNPANEFLVATGSTDTTVKLWDLRNMNQHMHCFEGHKEGVYQISWAPFSETILASCSADRRVHIWDLSRIGDEQSPEDAEDGPPELLFIHGGHTAKVSDFSWNRNEEWVAASVAEDNILQIWQVAESIYADEEDEEGSDADLEGSDAEGEAAGASAAQESKGDDDSGSENGEEEAVRKRQKQ